MNERAIEAAALSDGIIAINAVGDTFVLVPPVKAFKPAGKPWGELPPNKVFGSLKGWDEVKDKALRLKLFAEAFTYVSAQRTMESLEQCSTQVQPDRTLPDLFPEGTEFADVEGVPVSRSPERNCTAWDGSKPRRFNCASMSHNGTFLSEAGFRLLIAKLNKEPCE